MASEFDQVIQHEYKIVQTGIDDLVKALNSLSKSFDGIQKKSEETQPKVNKFFAAFEKLDKASVGVNRLGQGLSQIGSIFNNKLLTDIGATTSGITNLVNGLGDLKDGIQAIQKAGLGGALAGAAAVAGGIAVGGAIFDATRQPGQDDAGTIIKKGIAAVQFGVVSITEGSEAAGRALQETAENYGLIPDKAERANRLIQETADSYGNMSQALASFSADALRFANEISQAGGLFGVVGGAVGRVAQQSVEQNPALQAYIDYRKQFDEATARANEQTTEIFDQAADRFSQAANRYNDAVEKATSDYQRAAARAEQAYQSRVTQILEQSIEQENEIEQQYYDDRLKRAAEFGIETQRMEEDHQRAMRRLAEDSQDRIRSLVNARDALGIVQERRNYEKERSRAEEDYQVQASRRNADFARQLAEMENNFAQQKAKRADNQAKRLEELKREYEQEKAQRASDHAARLKELQDNLKEENAQIESDRERKLTELNNNLVKERNKIKDNFQQRLVDLDVFGVNQRIAYNNWLIGIQNEFDAWVASNPIDITRLFPQLNNQGATTPVGGPVGAFQHGGYTGRGGWVHANEFVLTKGTVRGLESMLNGPLSQSRILGAVSRGSSVTMQNTYNGMSQADISQYRRIARDEAIQIQKRLVN